MAELKPITDNDLLKLSQATLERVEVFTKTPRLKSSLDYYELASLSRAILNEMGRPVDTINHLLMMQTLTQLRENELKGVK